MWRGRESRIVRLVYAGYLKRDSDVLMSRQAGSAATRTIEEENLETDFGAEETKIIGFVATCGRKVAGRRQLD
jgi:hypothetical protein